MVVVVNVRASGRDVDEETRTYATLRRRGVTLKVLVSDWSGVTLNDSVRDSRELAK